jgi:hypothetical protein
LLYTEIYKLLNENLVLKMLLKRKNGMYG